MHALSDVFIRYLVKCHCCWRKRIVTGHLGHSLSVCRCRDCSCRGHRPVAIPVPGGSSSSCLPLMGLRIQNCPNVFFNNGLRPPMNCIYYQVMLGSSASNHHVGNSFDIYLGLFSRWQYWISDYWGFQLWLTIPERHPPQPSARAREWRWW